MPISPTLLYGTPRAAADPAPAQPAMDARPPLGPLLAAEAAAAVPDGAGIEAADLEQAVWLRLLERGGTLPADPERWVRAVVRAEARAAVRALHGRLPRDGSGGGAEPAARDVLETVLAAEHRRRLAAVVRNLPGRCPQLVAALMSGSDPTYREISRELGISQGSLGPLRSRCLGCLRAVLKSRVESPAVRGKAR